MNTFNNATNKKFMTTKELANVFDVANDTINATVEKLELNGVLRRVDIRRNSQGGYLFTEKQTTLIKQEIQKHHNLASRQIDFVSTNLEEEQTIINAMMILKRRTTNLQNQIVSQQKVIEEQKPKVEVYDYLVSKDGLYNFRDSSKILGIKEQDFMQLLKSKYIYKNKSGEYRAYAEYNQYFELRTFIKPNSKKGQYHLLNVKGLEYFKNALLSNNNFLLALQKNEAENESIQ